jgi:hypothetical protein
MFNQNLSEPVKVGIDKTNRTPAEFTWRLQRHQVRKLYSQQVKKRSTARVTYSKQIFDLQTTTGLRCVLTYEPSTETWRLERILGKGGRNGHRNALV